MAYFIQFRVLQDGLETAWRVALGTRGLSASFRMGHLLLLRQVGDWGNDDNGGRD